MRGPRVERLLAASGFALIAVGIVGAAAHEAARLAAIPAPAPLRGTQDTNAPAAATHTLAPPANVTAIAPSVPAVDSEPATTPDPLASLDPADRPIAERIRDLFAIRSDRIFAIGKERMAAQAL